MSKINEITGVSSGRFKLSLSAIDLDARHLLIIDVVWDWFVWTLFRLPMTYFYDSCNPLTGSWLYAFTKPHGCQAAAQLLCTSLMFSERG